jgi:hypothetical protein
MIAPQHQRVIDRLIELFKDDPRFPAMIIGGSVAKERALPGSDVDILLIASAEEYARRAANNDFWYVNTEICDYPGGYAEGKVVDLQFLQDAADHGSEPARAAFFRAFVGYSHIPELEALLQRIPVYQDQDQHEKLISFYSQVVVANWLAREAEKRKDTYLMTQAVAHMTLYGGRLLLAYNRVLYPYHKWMMYELGHVEKKPADFIELMEQLLAQPSKEHAQAFCDCLSTFHDWGVSYDQLIVRFLRDTEWNWRDGRAPLQDW